MACGSQGLDLPWAVKGSEMGTSLLQITSVYFSLLVICPWNDPQRVCIISKRLKAYAEQQREATVEVTFPSFGTFDSLCHPHFHLVCLCCARFKSCAKSLTFVLFAWLFACFAAFRHPAGKAEERDGFSWKMSTWGRCSPRDVWSFEVAWLLWQAV